LTAQSLATFGVVLQAAKLKGAQLGTSMVFLKYFHAEELRQRLELLNRNATLISKNVRRLLAGKELQRRREGKQRAIEEQKAKAEQEAKAAEFKRLQAEAAARGTMAHTR